MVPGGNKHDAVNAFEDKLSTCRIKYLPRNSIEVEPYPEASYVTKRQGKEVEEKRPLGLRGKRYKLSLLLRIRSPVDILEVCGLSAKPGAIVDNLAVNFT